MKLLQNASVQQLYKQLLQEAEKFPQYNYRMFALRKIRDEFESRKDWGEEKVPEVVQRASAELTRLRRMTTVASLYAHDLLVIEQEKDTSQPPKQA